ncbi:MEDS domain-containing protein [Amycolatopsis orientalis]|uniref:MEDS domain-containing protein n=1 Tax=Amycolatopsis orientalis TaxID=31958 RepID=UPI000683FD2D|nr:MEDS domain-containing protein [Amycolatopsis orientalis]
MKSAFRHQGCIYGSDAEFLAMAVQFAEEGLLRGEQVLVATTARNLELLHDALGADADRIEYAETAPFRRRPSQWAETLRGWARRRPGGSEGRGRAIVEPVWAGRSRREVAAWQRMEARLTVTLAGTGIWMICPYDTRVVEAGIVEDARRIHHECVVGRVAEPSARFMAPEDLTGAQGAPPSPDRPTDMFRFEGDLVAVRRYVLERATPILLAEDAVAMFDVAVGSVLANLLNHGADRAVVWVRPVDGRVVCTMHCDRPLGIPRPAGSGSRSPNRLDNSLRMAEQICEWLNVSSDVSGCTIELAMPGLRSENTGRTGSEGLNFSSLSH